MSATLERLVIEGTCGEPQPWNWKNSCRRRPGHGGMHRTPLSRSLDLGWLDGSVWDVPRLAPSAYLKGARAALAETRSDDAS